MPAVTKTFSVFAVRTEELWPLPSLGPPVLADAVIGLLYDGWYVLIKEIFPLEWAAKII